MTTVMKHTKLGWFLYQIGLIEVEVIKIVKTKSRSPNKKEKKNLKNKDNC